MTSDYRELKEREEELVRRREMSKSPTTTTTTTTSVHPRNPSPSLASTTRSSSPVKSTPTIKSSSPSPAVTAPSHAPPHHHVAQEKPKSRYKKTNKSVKENPKFCSRTQRLGFQREVQPVQLPATASSRWTTTSHHGRLHLQRRQVLTTYPLRCKSSWYFPKKDSYSRHFCQKVL